MDNSPGPSNRFRNSAPSPRRGSRRGSERGAYTSPRSDEAENWRRRPLEVGPNNSPRDSRQPREQRESYAFTLFTLKRIISEREPDALVIALSARSGWKLLLESDFNQATFAAIFAALEKCCKTNLRDILRRLMFQTFCENRKFLTRSCELIGFLTTEDVLVVENIIFVIEAMAWLQPAGLAKPGKILLCILEFHHLMSYWDANSQKDLKAKIKTANEQLTAAANEKNAESHSSKEVKIYKGYKTTGKAPNHFREVSILPTEDDMVDEHPFLRLNIVQGAYESLDDYLDVQFRLLREDFVAPFREALKQYKLLGDQQHYFEKLRGIQNVRFYFDVYVIPQTSTLEMSAKRDRVLLKLAVQDFNKVNWERSKRFINGSLIGISANNFENIIFTTVVNRDVDKLRHQGLLELECCFGEDLGKFKPDINFSLIESSGAYFEAYRHNLAVLQQITELPFSKYLVFAENSPCYPSFISPSTPYDLSPISKKNTNSRTLFRSVEQWLQPEETTLNPEQLKAVRSALTNELCLIQGPPGTGKTFVGQKIVALMLLNKFSEKPILVVCYTNHALDQFLEGISELTNSIVRIGGRCKTESLERFSLQSHRFARHREPGERAELLSLSYHLRREKFDCWKTIAETELMIERLEGKEIFAEIDGEVWEDRLNLRDIVNATRKQMEEDLQNTGTARQEEDDEKNLSDEDCGQLEEEHCEPMQVRCESVKQKTVLKLLGSYEQYLHDVESRYFDRLLPLKYKKTRSERVTFEPGNQNIPQGKIVLIPTVPEWWALYREQHWLHASDLAQEYLVKCRETDQVIENNSKLISKEELRLLTAKNHVARCVQALKIRLEFHLGRLRDILKTLSSTERQLDLEIIKRQRIVAMTTTGAAKYNEFLKALDHEIVIVEEAAEVLEAHIVSVLYPNTKQLVLIGDHQQLQPSTTVYNLAVNFNLQVSVFERLINNGISYVKLREQHRMRNEFLKLLVPAIYTDYYSHKSVDDFENIKGLSHNLFFVTHQESESSETENASKSNMFEANFVVRLSLYLRCQGYSGDQITILTTYSGQVFAVKNAMSVIDKREGWTYEKIQVGKDGKKRMIKENPAEPLSLFQGIRVTTVDNYQGRENDIIIASFVRSNDENKIGFLVKDNRVCVTLSRAKKGLYCVGNIAMLAEASQTWRTISDILLKGNYVNKGLELHCENHDQRLLATKADDFDKFVDGGCSQPCGERLSCGHCCSKTCHKLDSDHEDYKCEKDCQRTRACEHLCTLKCYEKCGPCFSPVVKILKCGHHASTTCSTPVESVKCESPCKRLLPCGEHRCEKECYSPCGKCMSFVEEKAGCGHNVRIVCRDRSNPALLRAACDAEVEKKRPCGHILKMKCSEVSLSAFLKSCQVLVKVECKRGHKNDVPCGKSTPNFNVDEICEAKTDVKLPCGHMTTSTCKAVDRLEMKVFVLRCKGMTTVEAKCGHQVEVECNKRYQKEFVDTSCQKSLEITLDCGHVCLTKCGSRKDYCCTKKCTATLSCGHLCRGNCSICVMGRFHRACRAICGKTKFCGHKCKSFCHTQCAPCSDLEPASCPHGVVKDNCSQFLDKPCSQKPAHCLHVKCEAQSCFECKCVCDKPCQRVLPCGSTSGRGRRGRNSRGATHRCSGLCMEACVCSTCNEKNIIRKSFPQRSQAKKTTLIKLPCGHVFEINWLDNFMNSHENKLQFPVCPADNCTSQIRRLRRYQRILEPIRCNMLLVYNKVFGPLGTVMSEYCKTFRSYENDPSRLADRILGSGSLPSLYSMSYNKTLCKVSKASEGRGEVGVSVANRLLEFPECQHQLLSESVRIIQKKTSLEIAMPEMPLPVDNWEMCKDNHLFSTARTSSCPECIEQISEILRSSEIVEEE